MNNKENKKIGGSEIRENGKLGKWEVVDRYFEGGTSCKEERELVEYFSQADVDESLREYQNYFLVLGELQKQKRDEKIVREKAEKNRYWIRRSSIFSAAAIVAAVLMTTFLYQVYFDGYVVIDGVKYKDKRNMEIAFNNSIQNAKMDMENFWNILNE